MDLPTYILDILHLLKQHAEAFLVGGCVRDMLMKRELHDYDITTNLPPAKVMEIFQSANYQVIPTGLKHGTLTIIAEGNPVEITTYRCESAYQNHRSPNDVIFTSSLEEDLKRRDFTMNAIAYDLKTGLFDPFHGEEDIKQRCIRCVGDPLQRFEEDALRILRALRFSCTLDFHIDDDTWNALQHHANDLCYISKERIRDEWNKILWSGKANTLQFLRDAKVLTKIIPELEQLFDHPQPSDWHIYDIFTHTDIALNHTKGYTLHEKLAIVLHDIGKVQCESFDQDGKAHYKGHASVSMQMAQQILKSLHYDTKTIQKVCTLIQYHDYYIKPKRSILRKYMSKFENDIGFAFEALDVQIADNYAKNPKKAKDLIQNIEDCKALLLTMEAEKDLISRKELALNGHDLLALGYQGKEIGQLLAYLYEYVLERPSSNTKEKLLQLVQQRNAK